MKTIETLISEIRKNDDVSSKRALLDQLKSLEEVKANQGLILKNAWLDIFPEIIQTHKEHFYDYFQMPQVRESFKDFIMSEFLSVMQHFKTTSEKEILEFTLWDIDQNNDGSKVHSPTLLAKQYYSGIKIADPLLSEEILKQTIDRFMVDTMGKSETYYKVFEKLTTDYGKMLLVTRIIEHFKVSYTSINVKPVLKYKKDLLDIFKKCLEDRNQNLIFFVGEYLEYISISSSTEGVPEFKRKVTDLLKDYSHDDIVQTYLKNTSF